MTNRALIKRMRDMADCADASYAFLDEVYKLDERNQIFGDNLTKGDKIIDDIKDDNGNILHTNGDNTTYARAIEARFGKQKVGDWCLLIYHYCVLRLS